MKKLYTFNLSERALAGLFKDLLQSEGVDCLVRNEQLFAALGEIPFTECFPELWVVDPEVYPRAKSLLHQWMKNDSENRPVWSCSECGEQLEGQFNSCWKCGRVRIED